MKKILITGGTGFFGRSILDYFRRYPADYEFKILSRHNGDIVGDVSNFVFPKEHYDAIVHLASPILGTMDDNEIEKTILAGSRHIAEFAKINGAKLLFASSGAVYGKAEKSLSEDTPCNPVTGYGKAKLESELYFINNGIDVKIARCFAFTGKFLPKNANFAIGNFIRDALNGYDIVIKGNGTPMRSYMYADDLVEWLFMILWQGKTGRPYNVGSDFEISIRDLAVLVRDTLKSQSDVIVLGKSIEGVTDYYVPNTERVRCELGVKCKINLTDAILGSI